MKYYSTIFLLFLINFLAYFLTVISKQIFNKQLNIKYYFYGFRYLAYLSLKNINIRIIIIIVGKLINKLE